MLLELAGVPALGSDAFSLTLCLEKLWAKRAVKHPRELTDAAAEARERILRAGIPVGNQSVLLRGINDDVDTMRRLNETLVAMRVRPYCCYQAQLLEGTAHFRVPIERGMEIFRRRRGTTSGFAIPQFVLDTPHGKVPLQHPWARTAGTATTSWSRPGTAHSGGSRTPGTDPQRGRGAGGGRAAGPGAARHTSGRGEPWKTRGSGRRGRGLPRGP